MDLNEATKDLDEYLPIRVFLRDGVPMVDWCYLGKKGLTEPFFDNTIEVLLRQPFNLLFRPQTTLASIDELYEKQPRNPHGLIFHMSRCGSTLLSRMLASVRNNIVISEATPIDSTLRVGAGSNAERIMWLRWIVGALGQSRGDDAGFFIKLDSWHTLNIELICEAFPDVPWIFLYRDPIEVIVSHMRNPGSQMVPGQIDRLLPGLTLRDALEMGKEEYCARVISEICSRILRHKDSPRRMFVNYADLPESIPAILEHFGLGYGERELKAMHAITRFDAKTPSLEFAPDSGPKQAQADDRVRQAAELVRPHYRELEATRRAAARC